MSQDTNGFVNIDYAVNQCLVDIEDYDMAQYQRFLQFANLGYTDLNLFVTQNVKVAYLKVNDNKTVDLPNDYMDYLKIGVEINGQVWTLTLNDDMLLPRTTDACGEIIPPDLRAIGDDVDGTKALIPNFGFYFAAHFRNGQYIGERYGIGGGFNMAYFRIDHEKRQIVFDSELPDGTIILEYKSSGVKADGSTVIPRKVIPALTAYIHWRRLQYNDKKPLSQKNNYRELYYIEYEKLQMLENSFTIDEYLDSTYRVVTSTVRR